MLLCPSGRLDTIAMNGKDTIGVARSKICTILAGLGLKQKKITHVYIACDIVELVKPGLIRGRSSYRKRPQNDANKNTT